MDNGQVITVFEDRQTKLNLTEKQKQDILALKDLWGSQNLILQADGTILLNHYVGFVARNQTRLQILPKIYENQLIGSLEYEKQEAIQLLVRLLQYSGYLSVKDIPNPQLISQYKSDFMEIFISIFVSQFLKLFTRNMHRQYENFVDNMQFIKGKIVFQQSVRENSYRRHLHFVEYDEFTVNNLLNQILKTIMLRLLCQTKVSENKKMLKLALVFLEDVNTIRLSSGIFDRVRFNRLNESYRPIFNLAKLFYYNYQPGYSEGDEYTFTFLVPLNRLYEYFIYKLLDKASFTQEGKLCKVKYQKPQGHLALCEGKGVFTLKPDITIMQDNQVKVILDTKYKNPIYDGKVTVSQTDIYQMLGYAIHYECKSIILLYPVFKGNENYGIQLATYMIPTKLGDIEIKIMQVDIMGEDIEQTQGLLTNCVINSFKSV